MSRSPLTPRASLNEPYLKTSRAKKHLDDLRKAITSFIKGKSYTFAVKEDLERRLCIVRVELLPIPDEIPLIAGDFFYCLRSSLDQLVWQLARLNSENPVQTQFPIFAFKSDRNAKKFKQYTSGVPSEAIRLIESLQPYNRRDVDKTDLLLWRLNEMCNIDKHRRISTTGSFINFGIPKDLASLATAKTFDRFTEIYIPLAHKARLAKLNPKCTIGVLLGDVDSDLRMTVADLALIYDYVTDKVIPSFSRFFPRPVR